MLSKLSTKPENKSGHKDFDKGRCYKELAPNEVAIIRSASETGREHPPISQPCHRLVSRPPAMGCISTLRSLGKSSAALLAHPQTQTQHLQQAAVKLQTANGFEMLRRTCETFVEYSSPSQKPFDGSQSQLLMS